MKKATLLWLLIFSCISIHAQLKFEAIENILKQDTGVSISEIPLPMIEGRNIKLNKLNATENYYGKHSVGSYFVNGNENNIVIMNDPNGRESFLIRLTKRIGMFDFGNLYRFELKRMGNRIGNSNIYEEHGIVVRDRASRYTIFVQVSTNDGLGIDSIVKTPNSIFENTIKKIYLFNDKFSLVSIFSFEKDLLVIEALSPQPKKMSVKSDSELIKELDHRKLISLYKECQEKGYRIANFKIDKDWGME